MRKKWFVIASLGLLLALIVNSTPTVLASGDGYDVAFEGTEEDDTKWVYSITFTADDSDVSNFAFSLNQECEGVYITDVGSNYEADVDMKPEEGPPYTLIKWDFTEAAQAEWNEGEEVDILVWFNTYPNVYYKNGGNTKWTIKAGQTEISGDIEGPWCGHFFVIPELPFGTISVVMAMFAAFGIVAAFKRFPFPKFK